MDKNRINNWLKEKLTSISSLSITQDLIDYIINIDNEKDIDEFFGNLLGQQHVQFCMEYKQLRQQCKNSKNVKNDSKDIKNDSFIDNQSESGKKKKKGKFVNIYSSTNPDIILLKGRRLCNCEATKHDLINNCLSCGRIICTQEGSGPCLFCESLVCSKEEQECVTSKKFYEHLVHSAAAKGKEEEKALLHRDRLLKFDQTSEKRTRVIDDEGEYYAASSVWLSPTERDKIKKKELAQHDKKHASRLQTKFTFDFAGRQILEHAEDENDINDVDGEIHNWNFNPTISQLTTANWKPEYVASSNSARGPSLMTSRTLREGPYRKHLRVQDEELIKMSQY